MQKDFSYPVKIANLNQQEQRFKIKANLDELEVLANILQVEKVRSFTADIHLKLSLKQHSLEVWGEVASLLEQKSVISLENFEKEYIVPFKYYFDTKATYRDIKELDASINEEVPDIIENGEIDLVTLAIEQLALQLDDYPRKDGEFFSFSSEFDDDEETKENPFAILKKLKK